MNKSGGLCSMTGFGRCFVENGNISQQWEIKSVNGRYLDLKWRLPSFVRYLEPALEKVARRYARRGRVEITLSLKFAPGSAPRPVFDRQQAMSMISEIKALATEQGEKVHIDYSQLIALPHLWGEPEMDDSGDLGILLEKGLAVALEDWNESREAEGAHLAKDLEDRLLRMREWTAMIGQAAPDIKEDRIQTVKERTASLLNGLDVELSEDRFLQEVVLLADKLDVSEELTRLDAHLGRLGQLLYSGSEAGRKLDFTLQECFREINTCGNKIQDSEISRIVVDFKNELEKCREQVQNLE